MPEIDIPFSFNMALAAVEGRKVATTRGDKKGEIGDTFPIPDPRPETSGDAFLYQLIEIMAVDLETVANLYFRLEGFNSPDEFRATWRALHRGHYTTDKLYYMHVFGRIA
jgi:hypothetical protein